MTFEVFRRQTGHGLSRHRPQAMPRFATVGTAALSLSAGLRRSLGDPPRVIFLVDWDKVAIGFLPTTDDDPDGFAVSPGPGQVTIQSLRSHFMARGVRLLNGRLPARQVAWEDGLVWCIEPGHVLPYDYVGERPGTVAPPGVPRTQHGTQQDPIQ